MDVEFIAKTIYIQSSDGNNIPQIYELQMENKENESKSLSAIPPSFEGKNNCTKKFTILKPTKR